MIDHSYSISTREVSPTNLRKLSFAAKLTNLRIVVNGLRIDKQYPNKEYFGNTQIEAMVSASDALRSWLTVESAENPVDQKVAS